jgi:indolepyruvate ferredoxin oxidoreductase beta subunit
METNIILAGVGGQGILSISFVIDMAALKQGLQFKQAEVHGMSQRGGAVSSHLRLSDKTIHSDLVPRGSGTLVLAVEPLESLRYIDYLSPQGTVVTGTDPFINIPDYADIDKVLDKVASLPSHTLIPADRLARQAGTAKAQNMVLLGAASPYLDLPEALLEEGIREAFARKGEKVQDTNIAAFRAGRAAGQAYRACIGAGISSRHARLLVGRLVDGKLSADALDPWKHVFAGPVAEPIDALLSSKSPGKIVGDSEIPKTLATMGESARDKLRELLFKAGS